MRAANEVEIVSVQKFGYHIRSERETHAAVVLPPPLHVLVWVGPKEIAQQS